MLSSVMRGTQLRRLLRPRSLICLLLMLAILSSIIPFLLMSRNNTPMDGSNINGNQKNNKNAKPRKYKRKSTASGNPISIVNPKTSKICNESIGWTNLPLLSKRRDDNNNTQDKKNRWNDFLKGPGLENCLPSSSSSSSSSCGEQRVCRIDIDKSTLLFHFPHAMQLIYSCISWWMHDDSDGDTIVSTSFENNHRRVQDPQQQLQEERPTLVLSIPKRVQKALFSRQNKFTATFLNYMQDLIPVEVRVEDKVSPSRSNIYVQPIDVFSGLDGTRAYNIQSPNQIWAVRDKILQNISPNIMNTTSSGARPVDCQSFSPRIGILNRRGSREILNAEELASALNMTSTQRKNIIVKPIEYFESKSFEGQIQFFATIDILISSHGAQLTGLPFMPSPCSSLLELFPRQYFIPYYFGSLAQDSHIEYRYLYLASSHDNMTEDGYLKTKAKSLKVCPNIMDVVKTIQQLIQEWRDCRCNKQNEL